MSTRDRLLSLLASAGGLGLIRGARGTYGSLAAVALYVPVSLWVAAPARSVVLVAGFLAACVGCVAVGPWAERYWGRKDPQRVVLDEVAAMLLVLVCYRVGAWWQVLAWGWPLTRLFDIIKPFPARRCERLPGGWGILLDDLAAAVITVGVLYALAFLARAVGLAGWFW